jgi:hypothetical protein
LPWKIRNLSWIKIKHRKNKIPFQMKTKLILIILYLATLAGYIMAQTPGFNYQAVLRDAAGTPMANAEVTLHFLLIEGTSNSVVYKENQILTSDELGILTCKIGAGTVESGNFTEITGIQDLNIKIEAELPGETGMTEVGESKLGVIPYALYGKDEDADPQNELQQLKLIPANTGGVEIGLTGSDSTIILPIGPDADNNPSNEIQDLKETERNDKLVLFTIESGMTTIAADANANNELQSLVAMDDPDNPGNIRLKLSPQLKANPLAPDIFQIVDRDSKNEIQTFNKVIIDNDASTDRLELIDATGNVVDFVILLDQNPNNELQKLSKHGPEISLDRDGMSVMLDDDDATNELQQISKSGNTILLNKGGQTVVLNDDDPNNELQDLTLNNDALSISGGNTISLDGLTPWQRDGTKVVTEGKIVADAMCIGQERLVFDDGTLSLHYNNGNGGIEISASGQGPVITFMDESSNVLGELRPDGEGGIELTSNSGKASSRANQVISKQLEVAGSEMLRNGSKTLKFPSHWNLSSINPEDILIIASPQSASSKGLAIVNKTRRSFEVKELFEGQGSYRFDYSIRINPSISSHAVEAVQTKKK